MLGLANKKKEHSKKVVVIGIDGLPFSLINEYMRQGVMPQFRQMTREGSFLRMKSSLPEVSSVAWTSFMTGKNPGEHGIFGFMELDDNYCYRFPNFKDIKVPTFWEKLDVPSVIINLPQTYPAVRPLKGVLVSGFVAIDLRRAVYPQNAYSKLEEIGYRLDVKAKLASADPDGVFVDLFEDFESRLKAIRYFFDHTEWQIFVGTITATDRLHHYFYPQALGEGPYHGKMLEFYGKLDAFLGEIYEKAKDQGCIFLTCSDHGFTPITSEVYLNRWLIENGYLLLEDTSKGLERISGNSLAFCLDPGRIYIHLKDRYPRGCVARSDYKSLRKDLAEKLSQITFSGKKVIKRTYLREEIFNGPYTVLGPDIYLLPYPGFDLKGAVDRPTVFGTSHFTGMHTYDDAHLFISSDHKLSTPTITDIASLIEGHFF